MFAEILVCDGCLTAFVGWSDRSREELRQAARKAKWLEFDRRDTWYCPACRLAVEHQQLVERRA